MKRCWMLIVCGALLWGGFVPETAALEVPGETIGEKSAETEKKAVPEKEEQPSEIDRILSGEEAIPLVSSEELEDHLNRQVNEFLEWFNRERHALLVFLLGSIGSLAVGGAVGYGFKKLFEKKADPKTNSLRWQLAWALTQPLLLMMVLISVFGFMLPVLQSLSTLYVWDARLFFTCATAIAAWAGLRLIEVLSVRMCAYAKRQNNNLDALMVDITRKVLKISLVTLTVMFIGQSIFNLNITTLLAGAGVVGLAIAFASRETLSNFFGTLVIIMDRPFRCGDRIQTDGIDGLVESVGMRSTRILTDDESVYTIPNSKIAESNIENISRRGLIRFAFTLGLVYDTSDENMAKAMKILHGIVDNFKGQDLPAYTPRIFFDTFGASAMNIRVIMWLKTASFETEEAWRTEINLAILKQFNEAGISMAYNTVTNYVKFDPAALPSPAAR